MIKHQYVIFVIEELINIPLAHFNSYCHNEKKYKIKYLKG